MPNVTKRTGEKGVALILTLILLFILTIMALSLMFLSQTETLASLNYRLMDQARDVAEAGVNGTANFIQNSYTPPCSSCTDVLSKYNVAPTSVSYSVNGSQLAYPVTVTYGNSPVILSSNSSVSSNYPLSSVVSSFNSSSSNTNGSLTAGNTTITYSTYAVLLNMWTVTQFGSSTLSTIQNWLITSDATVSGSPNAQVEISAIMQRQLTPAFKYAVETTATGCKGTDGAASIDFTGGSTSYTDSYDSSKGAYVYGSSFASGTGEGQGSNLGSNGYVDLGASTNVQGTISDVNITPVSSCSTGGITLGSGAKDQGTTKLGANLVAPAPWGCTTTPCYPSPLPPQTLQDLSTSGSCNSTGTGTVSGCLTKGPNGLATTEIYDGGAVKTVNQFTLPPGTYGNLKLDNADVVYLSAGTYNINSLNFGSDGQLVITSGPAVMNIAGQGFSSCTSTNCTTISCTASSCTGNVVVNAGGNAGWNLCTGGLPGNVGQLNSSNCPTAQWTSGTPTKTSAGNITGIPANWQVFYGGSAAIATTGSPVVGEIYAPSASVQLAGAPLAVYGAVVANTFYDGANSPIHYDTSLQNTVFQVGPWVLTSFTWKKY